MPRPRNPETKAPTLGGEKAVNFTVRLPLKLALQIEDYLHAEMKRNLIETGSRADASVASLFRSALEHYLECPQTTLAVKPRRRQPSKKAKT